MKPTKDKNVTYHQKNTANIKKSKINYVLIDNAEDVDIVKPKNNFIIKYSKNYLKTSRTLWNYTRDISVDSITNSESFKYKSSITGKTTNDGNTKAVECSAPLKHLNDFWKTLDMPLINCEVSLNLNWS